jgi:hypothetical protein
MSRGFTVLEALISLLLFVVILTSVLSVYGPSRVLCARGETQTDVQQNARLAMAEISRSIRLAGFFPENFTDTPPDPPLDNALLVATDDFLAIHGDADNSDASSAFAFCLDGTLLRRVKAAADDADAYDCSGEVLAENVTELRFAYYDADGNPLPDPPAAPYILDGEDAGAVPELDDTTERDSVRRVVVRITTEADTAQAGRQSYQLTSDAWLRNGG